MIPRITRGSSAAAALAYDFGPGRREEHVDARTVAGNLAGYWQDQASTMDTVIADRATAGGRGQALVKAVWRTSLRAAPTDRTLTDAEWGQIAERYITTMGLADHPWTATRHGEDHIHLTASRVSWTGRVASLSHDFAKAQSACRTIEAEHHLIDASTRYNRTKPQVVHGEREYAARRAQVPEREQLRQRLDAAASQVLRRMGPAAGARGITGEDVNAVRRQVQGAYEARLKAAGVLFRANRASTGRMSGYSYGLAGHTDAGGQQVFFKGSQLGKAYSWAATREHLLAAAQRAMMTKQAQTQDRQAQQEWAALPLGERAARLAQARAEQAARGQADAELMQHVPQRLWRRPGVAAGEQHRAATAAQGAATSGRAADQQPGQPAAQDPDHTQQPRRPGQELVSAAERERLRAEHDQIRARQAQQHKAMAAVETGHRQAIAAQQKAQQDLQAVSYRRNEALEQVGNAQRAASQAQGALERVRTEVEGRSWLGRARQQFAEDLGTVTGGRAGVPRGQDQARIRALQERAAAAERTLAAAERVLEASNQKVVAALKVAEGAGGAVQAAAQVLSQARKVRPESTMALTPYEELLFWERKAADPEGIRHKQEADAEHAEVMQARRRAQSLGHGPGRGPDRGHGYGR